MTMKRKYNILIVHNYYQIPGGEDTVVANERQMLEEHGHKVILYTRDNSEIREMRLFQKIVFPINMVFNLKTYREIKRIIIEERIDIVHVHNTLSLISPSVYYSAISSKVPVVQTVHNFRLLCPGAIFYRDGHVCEECVEKGLRHAVKHNCYRGSKIQTIACVINTKFHRATGIYGKIHYIFLTEFNKEKLLLLKQIKKENVSVKPNFVKRRGTIIPEEQRKNQFVFAGRLDKIKGVDILLEAWKQMGKKAPELIICGTGPMEFWCREFIEKNGLNHVKMKGFLPNEEVGKIVAESRALILPTQCYEGFPMSIVEAFSTGTPVICSDIGNSGSIVSEGITGSKFSDRDSLNDCVKKIVENQDMVMNVEEYYQNNFTAETNYKNLTQIYERLING